LLQTIRVGDEIIQFGCTECDKRIESDDAVALSLAVNSERFWYHN